MTALSDIIKQETIIISDGAWGTMLQASGLQAGECPELWNITQRQKVLAVAQSYVAAGARIIETNSFGSNRIKLAQYGLEAREHEINSEAARISCQAAGQEAWVMGSMGPTGKFLITGEISPEELTEVYGSQAKALADGGCHAIIAETMSDIDEALAAVQAVRQYTLLPVFVTFTFEKNADGVYRTMMGVTPEAMTQALTDAGADAIGANCGNGIEGMISIVEQIRSVNKTIPVIVNANAGLPCLVNGKTIFPEDPATMAARAQQLSKAGANIIGGCCGTTPEHITALRKQLIT